MSSWRDEYLASIRDAESNNPVDITLVEACSLLQDQVAALEAENAALLGRLKSSESPAAAAAAAAATTTTTGNSNSSDAASSKSPVLGLQLELAEALRSQGQLSSRLRKAEDELDTLRTRTRNDARTIRALTNERNTLATKVRDRDEELRGKSKLVEDVQDELIALNLQLNIAERERAKVQAENKELVDRWMKRMGQEAEAMNRANEPVLARGR